MSASGNSWLAAFPHEDAKLVVQALHHAWNELVKLSPLTFNVGRKEPDLTELLCEHLRAVFKQRTRLSGQWSYERKMGKITSGPDGTLTITNRKRTDIEYFSDRNPSILHLVFEFKKINHTSGRRKIYVGEDGMLRFVTGAYSAGQPSTVMVGILSCEEDRCVPNLISFLNGAAARDALRMKPPPEVVIGMPSTVFPDMAKFDTDHARDADLAPAHGTITISHLFLGFA